MFNDKILKELRTKLRKDQTDCERILWSVLRNRQLNGLKFFRQYSIGNAILDFHCPELRLGIELDGGQHNEKQQIVHDKLRTEYLKEFNINVIRFWNNEVIENLDGVVEKILEYTNKITPPVESSIRPPN